MLGVRAKKASEQAWHACCIMSLAEAPVAFLPQLNGNLAD
jgi:hypothetical protein